MRLLRLRAGKKLLTYCAIIIGVVIIFEWLRFRYFRFLLRSTDQKALLDGPIKSVGVMRMAIETNLRLHLVESVCQANDDVRQRQLTKQLDWSEFGNFRLDKYLDDVWWKPFYVSERLKLIFCSIPGSVSPQILKHMIKISSVNHSDINAADIESDNFEWHPEFGVIPLKFYSAEHAKDLMAKFKKVIFVRNPKDRLISIWKTKYHRTNLRSATEYFKYMKNPINLSTPNQFLEYLRRTPLDKLDTVLKPMYETCLLCAIRYDFIGHSESLEREVRYILPKTSKSYFENPPKSDFPGKVSEDAFSKIYKLDFSLFGYQ